MGIKGLLPLLKSIHKHCTLKKFSGQTIGVDAYGWLHRGVIACAFALALDKPTTIHIDFVLSRVRMLIDFGVTPYLVFDGDNLPSKAGTNAARRQKRQESRALGLELHKAGKTSEARQVLQKAIDVTPLMARQLIEELKKLNVQYIVAPYEADAQLVYLEQKGIIDGILAEDSDMLVYGAKRLLTKLNKDGSLVEIERADFALCKEISLGGWTDTMFRRMSILSGCDYLPNIDKLGLKTAHGLVGKYNDIGKIMRIVQLEGKLIVPTGYMDEFRNAELTFLHHRVFCPVAQKMVFLNDPAPGLSDIDMPFLGPYVDPETALGVARGNLDPFSKTPMQLRKPFARPALGDQRKQSYASAPELKPKQSRESFFKPYRQPLAELDPNSLTPSPSQQRLLERNRHASWEPRLVSSAPALRSHSPVPALPSDVVERNTFLARASTLSTYQAPKRQRLCSDSMEPSTVEDVTHSPFFSKVGEDYSPLAQKAQHSRRGRKTKVQVFADDNRATLLGPEIQQAASPDKDLERAVYSRVESGQAPGGDSHESIPQSSPATKSPGQATSPIEDHRTRSRITTVKEISQAEDPEAFVDLLEFHVRRQNDAMEKPKPTGSLMETFALQPRESRERALQSLPTPLSAHQTYFTASKEVQKIALESLPKVSGIESFGRGGKQKTTCDLMSPKVQQSALRSLNQQPVSAESYSEESLETNGQRVTANTVCGSEDSLVLNSEDEISEAGSPKGKLDLRAYAFVRG